MTESVSRARQLTPEEGAAFRKMREQADAEKNEIERRLKSEPAGPGSWADWHELRSIVDSLRAKRERRGLSRAEVAQRAALVVQDIDELEEHRLVNPTLAILSRYATAVGRHLMMGLSAGLPARLDLPVAPAQSPATSSSAPAG